MAGEIACHPKERPLSVLCAAVGPASRTERDPVSVSRADEQAGERHSKAAVEPGGNEMRAVRGAPGPLFIAGSARATSC